MQNVRSDFCRSVVGLLSFKEYQNNECLNSDAWQNAIDTLLRDRINVKYSICYRDGDWSYFMSGEFGEGTEHSYSKDITCEEVLNLDPVNLRIWAIVISYGSRLDHQVSYEDITAFLKFALPFVNMAVLFVRDTNNFPQNDLVKLLSALSNSSFRYLIAHDNSEEAWCALSGHLKSDSLKGLNTWDQGMSAEQKAELEECVLNSHFTSFCSDILAICDMDTFKQLFYKPQTEPRWSFDCRSTIELGELRDFEKHLQTSSERDKITWKRQDGREIRAKEYYGGSIWIYFS